jgi:hypothetical protein
MFSAKIREKSIGKMRSTLLLAVFLVPVVALIVGGTSSESWSSGGHEKFEEADFNIEFNATDEDLGVRAFVDGEPWKSVSIINPNWRTILAVKAIRSLGQQGLAELFFESGEPTLDDVSIDEFLDRFPEGIYIFFGWTVKGKFVRGRAEFTHIIPCEPEASFTTNNGDFTINWEEVEQVVNLDDSESGMVVCEDSNDLEIDNYEVVVEGSDGEFSIILPAEARSLVVPPEVGEVLKFEVLAIEESGNQTITEVEVVPQPE